MVGLSVIYRLLMVILGWKVILMLLVEEWLIIIIGRFVN